MQAAARSDGRAAVSTVGIRDTASFRPEPAGVAWVRRAGDRGRTGAPVLRGGRIGPRAAPRAVTSGAPPWPAGPAAGLTTMRFLAPSLLLGLAAAVLPWFIHR